MIIHLNENLTKFKDLKVGDIFSESKDNLIYLSQKISSVFALHVNSKEQVPLNLELIQKYPNIDYEFLQNWERSNSYLTPRIKLEYGYNSNTDTYILRCFLKKRQSTYYLYSKHPDFESYKVVFFT